MKKQNFETREARKFTNFGEQLKAVCNAGTPGGDVDTRLLNINSMDTSTPSDGGYLVQEEVINEILDNVYDDDPILSKVTRFQCKKHSNGLKINTINETSRVDGSRWGGIQAYWESEAEQIAASKPKFKQMVMTLKKLTGLCYATDELLEDVPALEEVIKAAFTNEFMFNITSKILYGSGVGEPLGIMNSNVLVTTSKEEGQTEIITTENLMKMLVSCYDRYGRAEWYMNVSLMPHLYKLRIGEGTGSIPAYIPGDLSSDGTPQGTLLGKKVNFIEQTNEPGKLGDIILADFSQYAVAEKGTMRANQSIHVRFIYDETAFRFVYRMDGQPMWKSTITPYKGSLPKSPFVTLEARITE